MWLINRKQSGRDPPAALTPDMVPPSMRPKVDETKGNSVYNNPELEMIAKDIQTLLREKIQLEKESQVKHEKTSKTGLQRPAARYDGIGKIGGGGYGFLLQSLLQSLLLDRGGWGGLGGRGGWGS